MVVITIETCKNAKVDTVPGKNKDFFWRKMKDMQDGLGIKNMCDLLKKEMCGIFNTKDVNKKQKGNM